jgi:hypothetical protein
MDRNKLISISLMVVGMVCLGSLFFLNKQKLIGPDSEIFIVRYFLPIMFINCGIYFFFLGVMFWLGLMVPYFKADKIEKAKHNFWGGLVGFPFFTITGAILILSESNKWKIIGVIFLGFYFYILISGYTLLKKHKHTYGDRDAHH